MVSFMPSNSPDEIKREEHRQELWQRDLAMPAPEWLDESQSPPIGAEERERLLRYARREITDEQELREITLRTLHFRSWAREYSAICAKEIREHVNKGDSGKETS